MRQSLLLVLLALGGCSFGIDPDSVARPCTCENKICTEDDGCGRPCAPDGPVKGCSIRLHKVVGARAGVGGTPATAAGGHSARGAVTFGASNQAFLGGHSLSGSVSSP